MGEGSADQNGVALAGLEPGTLQILEPGEDIKFSAAGRRRQRPTPSSCACSSAPWPPPWASPTSMLTGDLTQVNYSSSAPGCWSFAAAARPSSTA
jgi:hypothetical protein